MRSRDASASEFCHQHHETTNTKKREAERRKAHAIHDPHCIGQTSPSADAGRGSGLYRRPLAFRRSRRGACRSERTPQLSPGHASREREDAGVTRAVVAA